LEFDPPTLGATVPPAVPTGPGAVNVVTYDLPCRKCAYNLRGLSLDGRCPECGAAVGLSTYGDLLRYSDPAWVFKLQRGATFILNGIAVIVIGMILIVLLVIGGVVTTRGGGQGGSQELLGSLVSILGYGLIVAGSWLLTEPDPSGIGEDQYGTSRKIIRITLAMGVLNALLDFGVRVAPPPPAVFITFQVLAFVFGIAGLVGAFAQLQYLKKLALRIPDDSLAGRAQFLMYAIGASYGVVLLFGFLAVLATYGGRPPGGMVPVAALGCFVAIAGLALLVFGIMYLFMIDRFRRAFREQASAARASWARIAAPTAPTPASGDAAR
jgi:hypothetical protein